VTKISTGQMITLGLVSGKKEKSIFTNMNENKELDYSY
jgi:hypothetical protein